MPLLDVQARFREIGRIRIGDKGPKGEPRKLSTFRLTSPAPDILAVAAMQYGGKPAAWGEQWELVTERDAIDVMLPPLQAGEPFSQWYELWSGGGCLRRCDGRTEMLSGEPCKCRDESEQGEADPQCKPTTRLNLILPSLPSVGVWRLETHGWNAAKELVGTVNLMVSMAARGRPLRAVLRLEQRKAKKGGRTHRFVVPVLDIPETINELLTSAELPQVRQLTTKQQPEFGEEVGFDEAPTTEQPGPGEQNGSEASDVPATTPAPADLRTELVRVAAERGMGIDAIEAVATRLGFFPGVKLSDANLRQLIAEITRQAVTA